MICFSSLKVNYQASSFAFTKAYQGSLSDAPVVLNLIRFISNIVQLYEQHPLSFFDSRD